MVDSLIPVCLFLVIFGIFYLFLSTRNRERLALIEKGMDASLFNRDKDGKLSFQKFLLLNFSLLLMGIGLGVLMSLLINTYTALTNDALYPALIFLFAGASLLLGFYVSNRIDKAQSK
ncbi:hypothetical protein EGI22_04810 [Lacihabitans sp. LS3-19]|uniref:DUF6249 domain-containing protein n=1 Tax=Lacihabitans sp. LS3-19 TaxID=2487335 RepID=UPI0020CD6E54|nr:DUF6249 domain-containing protein [Lacihabitans sp. LS3-19]MCP9767220.1 hypothetical protein [Lacihabitans sp. LS3-19]